MEVRLAETPADLDDVRRLCRAFVAWHRQRHVENLDLIDTYFDADEFQRELDGLPGKYASPDGLLLLAIREGAAVGCVAARRIDDESCEMKRMFVDPAAQGHGVGRLLAEEVVSRARSAGYRTMYLDTSERQVEAQSLYRSLGFDEIAPYYQLPPRLAAWMVFMRLSL